MQEFVLNWHLLIIKIINPLSNLLTEDTITVTHIVAFHMKDLSHYKTYSSLGKVFESALPHLTFCIYFSFYEISIIEVHY